MVAVPELPAGTSIVVLFAVTIDSPLPAGVREIVNSGTVTSAETAPVATDDPALPGSADPTRIPVSASAALGLAKSAEPSSTSTATASRRRGTKSIGASSSRSPGPRRRAVSW